MTEPITDPASLEPGTVVRRQGDASTNTYRLVRRYDQHDAWVMVSDRRGNSCIFGDSVLAKAWCVVAAPITDRASLQPGSVVRHRRDRFRATLTRRLDGGGGWLTKWGIRISDDEREEWEVVSTPEPTPGLTIQIAQGDRVLASREVSRRDLAGYPFNSLYPGLSKLCDEALAALDADQWVPDRGQWYRAHHRDVDVSSPILKCDHVTDGVVVGQPPGAYPRDGKHGHWHHVDGWRFELVTGDNDDR